MLIHTYTQKKSVWNGGLQVETGRRKERRKEEIGQEDESTY